MTKQLDHLIEAKKEHEDLLLERAALLLNEKKLKIRDQQRLLATAKVDEKKLAEVQATRRPGGKKAPANSSKNKRKGPTPVDEDESDEAFDKMDVDEEEEEANDSEQEDMTTPDEDETEDDEEEAPPPPPSKVKGRIGGGRATKASDKEEARKPARNASGASGSSATAQHEHEDEDKIPPPRQLPFSSAKRAVAAPKPGPGAQVDGADDSTESDDEL